LDLDRNFSPPDVQLVWFEEQLKLAVELQKPVFLHERAAHRPFVELLSKYRKQLPGCCVHCFTGTAEELDAYLALDCHIGITGWIASPRGGPLASVIPRIPLDRLMIETDAPFLAPHPRQQPQHQSSQLQGLVKRVMRNEPVLLPYVLDALAEILQISVEDLAAITTRNSYAFFGLATSSNSPSDMATPPSSQAVISK
jgi:TatD DNase family protein